MKKLKELTEKQKVSLAKQRDRAADVRAALDDDLPYDIIDALQNLGDKDHVKELKSCFKRGGVDASALLGAVDTCVREWKQLNKMIDEAVKVATKEEAMIAKQFGE